MKQVFAMLALLAATVPVAALELGPPVACAPSKDCFLQQAADMTAGAGVSDPFCGSASYDGHTGLDIRVRSLADLDRDVPVLAMADGTVRGVRDGQADRLAESEADRAAIKGVECGNGVVIDHGGGLETQYCHLERGSVSVRGGQAVKRGDRLGSIGASGLAQFPHVHAEARFAGKAYDIITGRGAGGGCDSAPLPGAVLLEAGFAERLGTGDATLLGMGMAGSPLSGGQLVREGPPPAPTTGSQVTLGWAWFSNLKQGDRLRLELVWPDGVTKAEQEAEPLDRNKANWVAFAGRKRKPVAGDYLLTVEIVRGDELRLREMRRLRVD